MITNCWHTFVLHQKLQNWCNTSIYNIYFAIYISNEQLRRISSRYKQLFLFRYIIILLYTRKSVETSKNTVLAVFFAYIGTYYPPPPQNAPTREAASSQIFFYFIFFLPIYCVLFQIQIVFF